LISDNQTTFIAGRQIVDGYMITNEVVHSLKTSGHLGLIFKVDSHKAFDSVLWDYLVDILSYMGFSEKWRSLIYQCILTSKLSVLINGSPTQEFGDLHQGDNLTSFFCLRLPRKVFLFSSIELVKWIYSMVSSL